MGGTSHHHMSNLAQLLTLGGRATPSLTGETGVADEVGAAGPFLTEVVISAVMMVAAGEVAVT